MKTLLISPRFPESFWGYNHALKIVNKQSLLPPLGLLTVAAILPESWDKRLVDVNVRPLTEDDLAWADIVFVGGMGVQWENARDVIARAKAAGKRVVAGGPLFTAGYALFQNVDHFVLNEAELTLPPFIADMEAGRPKRMYRTRDHADMSTSPIPLWKIADLSAYYVAGVQYSRGCPFDCDFCNVTAMLGRKPRIKSAAQVIAELDALYAAGWRGHIFFVDDNLIGNKRALRDDLLPALIQWQKTHGHLPLCTQASVNLADDEPLMESMVEAGFDTIFVGIESSDPAALQECHKGQNRNRDLVAEVKKLQRAGLEVQAGFILGFDHDSDATFQQQVDFIQKSGIVTAMVGQLQAPPGTRLLARLTVEGRVTGISMGDNTDGNTNVLPKMGVEKLRAGHAWVLNTIYSPQYYYERLRTFLAEYPPSRHPQPLNVEDVVGFLRAAWRLGIRGAERTEFWKLLAWTIRHRPSLLGHAVRLACYGYHNRLVAEQVAERARKPIHVAADDMIASLAGT